MVRIVKRREGDACRELHLASKLDFYRVIGLGAARRTQTLDPLLTRQPLYQLSYDGIKSTMHFAQCFEDGKAGQS